MVGYEKEKNSRNQDDDWEKNNNDEKEKKPMNYLHERTGEKKEREDIAIENGMLTSTTTLSSSIREHHLVFFSR